LAESLSNPGYYSLGSTLEVEPGTLETLVNLDASHPVFLGHFPGMPVLPGVCMLQIMKHVLEKKMGRKLMLVSVGQVKFLSLIDPNVHPQVVVQIRFSEDAGGLRAGAEIVNGSTKFCRIQNAGYR
jgi:3-hydroxyacyl-[acyl-carrier-protein] dehydratase